MIKLLLLGVAAVGAALGQSSVVVPEPSFPPVCTQLAAQIAAGPLGLAAASETTFDTGRIQSALAACPPGGAVELTAAGANNAFLIQPIQLPAGVTLLVDAGVTVFASRNPRDYDAGPLQSCGGTASGSGCVPLILSSNADGSGIMGYGEIDGRGGTPMLINGVPSAQSWWDLAVQANCPRMIQINGSNHFTLYKITLRNAACNFHVAMDDVANFTAYGIKIVTPYDTPNTVGVATGHTDNNVIVANSYISDGDDYVAVNGATSPGANNITVVNNHFGDGHGVSIGSITNGGVANMLVDGNSISGDPANRNQIALRIKSDVSRGGLVQNIAYRNLCIQNSRYAMQFNPFYTAGATGTLVPWFQNIAMTNVHALTEGLVLIEGHDASVPTGIALSNVVVDGIKSSDVTSQNAKVTIGPDPVNFASMLNGTGVSVTGQATTSNPPYACPASAFPTLAGELVPGPPRIGAGDALNLPVEVLPVKAVPYQTYLTNRKTNPNATLALPAPTGTVRILDGTTQVGSAPMNGGNWVTVPVQSLAAGGHTLTASYSGDASYAAINFGSYTVSVAAAGTPVVGGIGNAASGTSATAPLGIAPGSLLSIYGSGLGSRVGAFEGTYPLPVLGGTTSVKIVQNGSAFDAYIAYAVASQINAVLPSGVTPGDAELTVTYNGVTSQPVPFHVLPTALGIFTVGGMAVAQNVGNYGLNTPASPAKPGDVVILWGTGMGAFPGADTQPSGVIADLANVPVSITVGGMTAQRLYAGRQPGTAAVDNVYFAVPSGVSYGCQIPVAVTAGGVAANATTIAITVDGRPCQ